LTVFSKIFTGIEISNKRGYYEKWTLDLGTGNILIKKLKRPEQSMEMIPDISNQKQNFITPNFR